MANRVDQQRRVLQSLYDSLEEFRKINQNMSVQQIMAFLMVAVHEGSSLKDLAKIMDIKVSTLSRILIDLGFRNRRLEPGHNMIECRQDPLELRKNQYTMSRRGSYLIDSIVKKLGE